MTAILTLWSYALAALLFGVASTVAWRRGDGWQHRALAGTLFLTALWALAVAGIDARDVGTEFVAAVRNLAWLSVMAALVRRTRSGHGSLAALYLTVAAVMIATIMIAIAAAVVRDPGPSAALAGGRGAFEMMGATGALLLLHHLARHPRLPASGAIRVMIIALGVMWGSDLVVAATDMVDPAASATAIMVRGVLMIGVAVLLSAVPIGDAAPRLSRSVALRVVGAVALILYAGFVGLATYAAGRIAGDHERIVQTSVVIGGAAALLALASTPWLRAWFRVKVAKHLFSHRYDYRVEWQRFTATLGAGGDESAPLAIRVVKALGDLVDAPAGLLLLPDGERLVVGEEWNWTAAVGDGGSALARHMRDTGRIVVLDDPADVAVAGVPDWLSGETTAWIVMPLFHADALVGAVALARPPVERPLDWEDLDLLRVAGRQAASFLAEEQTRIALDEARRFDEFNRRFAFLLHDIKNVASQLTLVARNAERHADNPEFRADMVATLRDSAGRMTTLLGRLGQHDGARPEPSQPVDIAALAMRVVASRRAQHPIETEIVPTPLAIAQPSRLEQVVGHLVQNAIEASGSACPIRLSTVVMGDAVAITVADSGSGMTPGFVRDDLFRPFVSTKAGGFGVGAYEARQLVVGMGGRLDVESRVGEGTRFRVILPIAKALEAAA